MKRLITALMMAFMAVVCVSARTYVLCIGVSRYVDSANNLGQSTKDTKQFKELMEKHANSVVILTSKYANKSNILAKLRTICNKAQKGDKIIFYYSGHGTSGGIVPYDQVVLDYQTINNMLAQSNASVKICFVDACMAGSVSNVSGSYNAPSAGNIIYMMSCRADELSMEHPWVGHGLFTQALLKGLRGKADANRDKKITVKELFTYVYNDVQHATARMGETQHPQLIGSKAIVNEVVVNWN